MKAWRLLINLFSPDYTMQMSSAFPCKTCFPVLLLSSPFSFAALWMHSNTLTPLLYHGAQSCKWYSKWGCIFDQLAVLYLMHLKMAARALRHWWLIFGMLSTSTPRFPSTGMLSSHSSPRENINKIHLTI